MWNMRKSSSTSTKRRNEVKDENKYVESEEKTGCIEWEVRPGGMLVQKRSGVSAEASSTSGPMINIKVSYDSCYHDLTVPAESKFGGLKKILCDRTGLHPTVQRLLFQGKEKDDNECLHYAGVKDMSKVILMEDPASKERKNIQGTSASCEAIARVRVEVDSLSQRVVAIEEAVQKGMKVDDREFVVLTELFMIQLLALDSIEAEGEARAQRRTEVPAEGYSGGIAILWRKEDLHLYFILNTAQEVHASVQVNRIQSFADMLDNFKARNSNFLSNCVGNSVVSTKWETFDSGVGSLNAPNHRSQHSTKITQDWEVFD